MTHDQRPGQYRAGPFPAPFRSAVELFLWYPGVGFPHRRSASKTTVKYAEGAT